jgi:hypothetical protein
VAERAIDGRQRAAEAFLTEAVYRSRARQAAAAALLAPLDPAAAKGRCGLGESAAVVLDLSDAGRELFAQLWPDEPAAAELARIRARMTDWVEAQDALDRQRNHFLKGFRTKHGFDRTRYDAAQLAEFETGLARINAAEDDARRTAALALITTD